MTQFGIDVSNHQRNFDFAGAAAEGYTFATHKITESNNYKDPYWPRALNEMRKHFPNRFGGYHFWRRSASAESQADLLAQHIGDLSVPIQLDFEDTSASGVTRAELDAIVNAIQARGMIVFADYIPRWYWQGAMNSADLGGTGRPLWASDYGPNNTGYGSSLYDARGGDAGPGWNSYGGGSVGVWQFGEKGLVAGQSVDVNAIRGTIEDVEKLIGKAKPVGNHSVPEKVLEQETGSTIPGEFPGWKARRWNLNDADQPTFTQTDFNREIDREINSVFSIDETAAPAIETPDATLVGQVLATRKELKIVHAKLDRLLAILEAK